MKISNTSALNHIKLQQTALNTLFKVEKKTTLNVDLFVRSGNTVIDSGIYTPDMIKNDKNYISDELLLLINNARSLQYDGNGLAEYKGIYFYLDQIPPIDASKLSEMKAVNNSIDFGQNSYFKYVDNDGAEHVIFTGDKGIETPNSESLRGAEIDKTAERWTLFWRNIMADDPVYIGLTFSDEEIRSYLDDAGIKEGFFHVTMGEKEADIYYSGNRITGAIQSKERYDEHYKHLTQLGNDLYEYKPESVFKIAGKEYVLSENHTLDIPYGEDIWQFEIPDEYKLNNKSSN